MRHADGPVRFGSMDGSAARYMLRDEIEIEAVDLATAAASVGVAALIFVNVLRTAGEATVLSVIGSGPDLDRSRAANALRPPWQFLK
jgi:hypothetical protein